MIDLHCSFIDMGRLRRTCMLIVTSSRGFDALDVYVFSCNEIPITLFSHMGRFNDPRIYQLHSMGP